jgi:hypothetical protein
MADTPTHLEEMGHALFPDEAAHFGVVLGMARGRRGRSMVEGDAELLGIGDVLAAELVIENPGDGGRIIMSQNPLRPD